MGDHISIMFRFSDKSSGFEDYLMQLERGFHSAKQNRKMTQRISYVKVRKIIAF